MADLIPRAPNALAQAPQSKVGGDAFDRPNAFVPAVSPYAPQKSLAAGLEQFAAGLEDLAVPLAKQQGAANAAAEAARTVTPEAGASALAPKSIALDSAGLPQVLTPTTSFVFGRAGAAYSAAHDAGIAANLKSRISRDITDLRNAHPGDQEGFLAKADAYASHWQVQYPGALGADLANQATDIASRHYESMANQKSALDLERNKQALLTEIGDTQSKMRILARGGGIATPEYDGYQDQLQDAYDRLGTNPLFSYGTERTSSELDHSLSTDRAEYTLGQVDAIYDKSGKAAAFKMLTEGIANNRDLNLAVEEREKLVRLGMSHLDYLTSAKKAEIDASRETTKPMLDLLRDAPWQVTPAMRNEAMKRARAAGDSESVFKLEAAQNSAASTLSMRGLTDEQRVMARSASVAGGSEKMAVDRFVSKGWSQVQASGIVGNLIRESRLNPAAINRGDGADGSDSIGIGQWNGSRAVALKAFAAAQGKPWQDLGVQLDFVQHELEGSEGNAAKMLRGATDARSAAAAFALGYERPQGFMTGDVMKVAGGKDRVAHAERLAGGGASSAPIGARPAPSQAEMDANPYALPTYLKALEADEKEDVRSARNVGEALTTQYGQGNLPPPEVAAAYLQMADRHPNDLGEQALKIRNLAAGADLGEAINRSQSAAVRQQHLSQVEELMRSGDLNSMAKAHEAKLFIDRGAKALQDDPWNEMPRRGWLDRAPTPPDLSTPEGVAALPRSIQEHVAAAVALTSFTNVPAPIFSKAEMPMMKAVMETAPFDTRVALASVLMHSNMPEPIRHATLAQLGGEEATRPLALAGDIAPYAPNVAREIVAGQALLQTNEKLAPKSEGFENEFAKRLSYNDFQDGDGRKIFDAGIRALYAKRSAERNNTTGVLDESLLDGVIKDVTGGIVEWRGSSALAPWYGAGQNTFDAVMRSVTDADLKNAVGSDGKSLPASYLRPSVSGALKTSSRFRLQSYGPGKYLIFSGPDEASQRQYLRDPTTKQKFVLDLGVKRSQVEAEMAGELSTQPYSELFWKPTAGPM